MSTPGAKKGKGEWKHVDGGYGFVIPYTLLRHPNMARLGPHGNKLLLDMCRQYSGFNNGYLKACWEHMSERGWRSKETLFIATAELVHYNLIEKSRQGGRNRPNLYYLTWWPIHTRDDDPLDVSKTAKPCNSWKLDAPDFDLPTSIANKRKKRNE